MANLHDIERRKKSVESTRQVTRTMEMVAAAKIAHSQNRVTAATPYANAMEELLGNIGRMGDCGATLTKPHDEVKTVLMVVIVSDRGLAGGFNSNVLRRAEKKLKKYASEEKEVKVIACGKKAISFFKYRDIEPILAFRDLSADPRVEEADAIADYAIKAYINGEIDQLVVLYNHSKNAAEQVVIETHRLPIKLKIFTKGEPFKFGGITDPDPDITDLPGAIEYEPGEPEVLEQLLPEYMTGMFYYFLIDSAAAEQAARRTAMKTATDNANEMIDMLNRLYNRVRQGAITTELNEIVGGAAALED